MRPRVFETKKNTKNLLDGNLLQFFFFIFFFFLKHLLATFLWKKNLLDTFLFLRQNWHKSYVFSKSLAWRVNCLIPTLSPKFLSPPPQKKRKNRIYEGNWQKHYSKLTNVAISVLNDCGNFKFTPERSLSFSKVRCLKIDLMIFFILSSVTRPGIC